jgi:hypothetical protein
MSAWPGTSSIDEIPYSEVELEAWQSERVLCSSC